jgi:hypothetical protein
MKEKQKTLDASDLLIETRLCGHYGLATVIVVPDGTLSFGLRLLEGCAGTAVPDLLSKTLYPVGT